ncbi:MAG TPA: TonB-dependent receptor, partial [Brevundimonas sp.]|nr:TonB-dependent receptor [Brevundimonas sp.]
MGVGQVGDLDLDVSGTVVAGVPGGTSVDDIVVVGSNIRGGRTTAALPVVVVDQEQIDATGAVSGDELMRTIPQMGDVLFDASNNPQTSNAARGDVNSVNLRSLGVGNTLVLLNGRRLVAYPTSQGTSDTGTVPVISYNSNAIPVGGLDRLEVLLDGAAAIYGADAVAGVVNTVLQDDFDGLTISTRYGGAEGT